MSKRKANDSIISSTKDIDITSLPDGVLSHISGYVQHSSRQLFAVAMTAPPSSFRIHNCNELPQSTMRDAILFPRNRNEKERDGDDMHLLRESQVNWNEIDFGGVDEVVGGLTDDTLHACLVCIGVSRIKSLEFTRCSKFAGWGLYPLWRSKVLERIDLSGIKAWSNSKCDKETRFTAFPSESQRGMLIEAVIPVLESIVDETDNSLWHIQFPKHFRIVSVSNIPQHESFHRFLTKFNDNISRKIKCGRKKCDNLCYLFNAGMHMGGDRYGIQSMSCSNGHFNFCGCQKQDRFDTDLSYCHKCMKYYCDRCNPCEELICGCGKLPACGSCSDSAYCDYPGCSEGPFCSDCILECKCGQRYCRMEEACESVCNVSLLSYTFHRLIVSYGILS